jgi:hypothetical protein
VRRAEDDVSPGAAVLLVVAVETVAGIGLLAAIGLVSTPGELRRYGAIAPLAGMAWVGIIAATVATIGSRLSIAGLLLVTVVTCAIGGTRVARRKDREPVFARAPRARSLFDGLAIASALLALAIVSLFALSLFLVKPLAEYDGWAMWGMKSRAIAALGGDPGVFASPAYARLHLEYPLLLPSLHALPLQLIDGFTSNAVVLGCLAIGFAGLGAVWGLLRDRVRASLLLPSIAALASAPAFFTQLSTGYADIPVAMFAAAGALAAARWLLDDARAWLVLTTLFLTAACLTKNEGLLSAAATYVSLLIVASGRRRAVLVSGLVAGLVYAPWRAHVAIHDVGAPAYDLAQSFNVPFVVPRLGRAPEAGEALLRLATDEYQFGLVLALGVAAVVVASVIGPRRLGAFGGAFGLLSLAGLSWIYVLATEEVSTFISTNGDRVVVSLVVGLLALAPLLFEEAAQELAGTRAARGEATTAPAGSSNPSEAPRVWSPPTP